MGGTAWRRVVRGAVCVHGSRLKTGCLPGLPRRRAGWRRTSCASSRRASPTCSRSTSRSSRATASRTSRPSSARRSTTSSRTSGSATPTGSTSPGATASRTSSRSGTRSTSCAPSSLGSAGPWCVDEYTRSPRSPHSSRPQQQRAEAREASPPVYLPPSSAAVHTQANGCALCVLPRLCSAVFPRAVLVPVQPVRVQRPPAPRRAARAAAPHAQAHAHGPRARHGRHARRRRARRHPGGGQRGGRARCPRRAAHAHAAPAARRHHAAGVARSGRCGPPAGPGGAARRQRRAATGRGREGRERGGQRRGPRAQGAHDDERGGGGRRAGAGAGAAAEACGRGWRRRHAGAGPGGGCASAGGWAGRRGGGAAAAAAAAASCPAGTVRGVGVGGSWCRGHAQREWGGRHGVVDAWQAWKLGDLLLLHRRGRANASRDEFANTPGFAARGERRREWTCAQAARDEVHVALLAAVSPGDARARGALPDGPGLPQGRGAQSQVHGPRRGRLGGGDDPDQLPGALGLPALLLRGAPFASLWREIGLPHHWTRSKQPAVGAWSECSSSYE